tara:strand:+ start:413 stop:781 length:369 start_codon:yes stop_codon:yes gene_type:complete
VTWLAKIGLMAFFAANTKILFRLGFSSGIIFLMNLLYSKYEALLLATNPDKLFIPLFIFTLATFFLIIWTLLSFKWFSSFNKAKEQIEIQRSFNNKPDEYKKFSDALRYPKLKTKKDRILYK